MTPDDLHIALCRWLSECARRVEEEAPDLSPTLRDYLAEARFGAEVVSEDLTRRGRGARVLEVGAGAMLLSGALAAQGYAVVALEPSGPGFAHLDRLRSAVVRYAATHGGVPEILRAPAEALEITRAFDYAFSINVMEHVRDVRLVLDRVWRALAPGGEYRFVCPNYAFPYEPHFAIPILGTRSLTRRVFARRIGASRQVVDPAGTWSSLNWISVRRVRRICRELRVVPGFDRTLLRRYVQRASGDPTFAGRHPAWLVRSIALLERAGVLPLLDRIPAGAQPAMSVRIVRPAR